jgi:hypothetical protein
MDIDWVLEDLSNAAMRRDRGRCEEILHESRGVEGFLKECTHILIRMLRHCDRLDCIGCVKLFLSYGVPIESEEDPGAALHYAIQLGYSNQFMYLLLDDIQNIDVNQTYLGCAPIQTAIEGMCNRPRSEAKDQIVALLVRGADVHTIDRHGNSLLHELSSGDPWLIELLSRFGVDFNRKGRFGRTPLQSLLRRECEFVRRGDLGPSALRFDFAESLIRHGADIHRIQDDSGQTAIQFAKKHLPPGNRVRDLLIWTENMEVASRGFDHRNGDNCLLRGIPVELLRLMGGPTRSEGYGLTNQIE